MTCEEFEGYITDYLEGTLAAELRAAVESHRLACTACQSLTSLVAQIITTCHSLPRQDPDAELVAKILQRTSPKGSLPCEQFEEHISDYLEGTLAPELYIEVENHRTRCPACQDVTAMVAQIIDICHAQPTLEPQADLVTKILQRTPRKGARRFPLLVGLSRLFQPVLWPKVAVGTALIIGFLSLGFNLLGARGGYKKLDQYAHQVYGQGLKLYDRKNQWQAQMKFLTESLRNRITYQWQNVGNELQSEPVPSKEEKAPPPEPKRGSEKRGAGGLKSERLRAT